MKNEELNEAYEEYFNLKFRMGGPKAFKMVVEKLTAEKPKCEHTRSVIINNYECWKYRCCPDCGEEIYKRYEKPKCEHQVTTSVKQTSEYGYTSTPNKFCPKCGEKFKKGSNC